MAGARPSARGLFRATGKTAKPVAVRGGVDLAGAYELAELKQREKDDFYPTPPEPIRAFLHAEGARLREIGGVVWEPAAGDGALAREMRAVGFAVACSDLIDRGCGATIRNFYGYAPDDRPAGVAVTNPPFGECGWGNGRARWIVHARETLRLDYLALLMNWSWPGAGGLAPLWHRDPPARVYLMRWKIDFTGQGAPPMLNAWFVWDGQTAPGDVRLLTLDRKDARQGEMFSDPHPATASPLSPASGRREGGAHDAA